MLIDQFNELIDPVIRAGGSVLEIGEEFRAPPLDVLRYYHRSVSMNWIPIIGRAHSVVALVQQPVDIGLTAVILTPEPIGPNDDTTLGEVLEVKLKRMRVVPFGLIRVNLGQEAVALAIHSSPDGLFPEPVLVGDALCEHFRRYVPLIDM